MIISHDIGTTGDKATLVDSNGDVIAATTEHYGVDFGPDGRAEQNPLAWWDAFGRANRSLIKDRAPTGSGAIDAVSFSGQMMGVVPVDADGDPVRPAIIWADTRSTQECNRLIERVGMARAYAITGHRLNPTYSVSKLMWLRKNEPDSFARIETVLQAKDFLAMRLTGNRMTDPSDASGTNAYDQATGEWSLEVLDGAELPATLFPEIVPSTTIVGTVSRTAAEASGLPAGTPVVIGGGDGPMAALGAGVIGPESGCYAYLGSSSWVSIATDAPLHDPEMRTMTFNHVLPGRFVPTATMQTGGASLQWIAESLAGDGETAYSDLLTAAGAVEAARDGLYFLPHLLGERSPYWNPKARAAFVGLKMHHGRGHLVRAVLEGIAFNLYTGLRAFAENGVSTTAVDVVGGAARSAQLLQIFADVWGVTVSARTLSTEANAIGAAIVGGIGVGIFDDADVAYRHIRSGTAHTPGAGRHSTYAREYDLFLDAYRRLEPWFEEVAR